MARDQNAFWRAICKTPGDDTVRLVYADWLDENGYAPRARARVDRSDPLALGRARAEFIRVQCELARLPIGAPRRADLEAREHLLLTEHRRTWIAELPEWLARDSYYSDRVNFRRGFPSTLNHSAYKYGIHARGLVTSSVIDDVEFWGSSPADVERIAVCAHLPRLRRLKMSEHAADLHLPIFSAPALTGLRELGLTDPTATDAFPVERFAALLATPPFRALEALELSLPREYAALGTMLDHLGAAPLDRLTRLNFVCKPNAAEHWRTVLAAPFAPRLTELLMNTWPEPAAIELIARTERLPELQRLLVTLPRPDRGGAPEDGAKFLAAADNFPKLVDLRLLHCDDVALALLADAPILDRLAELHVTHSAPPNGEITVNGWRTLVSSPRLKNLSRLRVFQCELTDDKLRALAESPHLGNLAYLGMGNNDAVTEDGLATLADSPHLAALRVVWYGLDHREKSGAQAHLIRRRFAGRFLVI
jgi:uncharacterized protein (TIGR02996 family)